MIQATQIAASTVFLVSGGARGITAECVLKLAQVYRCKFILLGRSAIVSPMPDWVTDWVEGNLNEPELKKRIMENLLTQGEKPTPAAVQKIFNQFSASQAIQKTLRAIEQAGGQAIYISADITDASGLAQKIAASGQMNSITGIIHGAGNLADKRIERKTEQDFESVYTAKVKGLENLLGCISPAQLQHLVLFSSVSGFYGNVGQSDYAIANEILNKSAYLIKHHHPHCHVVAINWGPWDSGMVTPELKKAFSERKIEVIPIEVGARLLVNELESANHSIAQVVIGSPLVPIAGQLSPALQTHHIRRVLTLKANPFLRDHTIAGYPVLPATCAVAWIGNTCEQLYPGYKFFSCTNFKVLKGIIFDQNLASEYTLELKEIAKANGAIEFEAKVWSKREESRVPYHYHYTAQIKLLQEIAVAPTYSLPNLAQDLSIRNQGTYHYQSEELSLFHGDAFRGVKTVLNLTPEVITLKCIWQNIKDIDQGQFPVQTINPYIADIQMHAPWIWMQYLHQSRCLPAQMQRLEQFSPVPFGEEFYVTAQIKDVTESYVLADIAAHTAQGKIYSRILGAKGTVFPLELSRRR